MKRKRSSLCSFFVEENTHQSLDLTKQSAPDDFRLLNKKIQAKKIKSLELSGDIYGKYRSFILMTLQLAHEHNVEEIILDTILIGDKGIELLQDILQKTQYLKKLELIYNELTNEQVIILSEGLKKNKTLIKLNLSSNDITGLGMKALGEALEKNDVLQELNLSYNPDLGDEGILAFCPVLEFNKKLEVVNLRQCNITDEGFEGIRNAVKSKVSALKEVDLRDNEISNTKANGIVKVQLMLENEHERGAISSPA